MSSATTADRQRLVALDGDLDCSSASELRSSLRSIIDGGGVTELVIDASEVTFVDSTALGVLFGAHCRMQVAGGRLRVVNPSVAMDRVLRVTGLAYWLTD